MFCHTSIIIYGMLKKIIIIICLIAGVFILSSLCNKNSNDGRVIIQFASWGSESEIKILKPLLVEFEKENPDIKVDFMHIPQNYFQKLHLLYASNTAPDVVFINNQYLPIYANAGVLEDLSQYSDIFEYEKFYPKSIQTMTYKGKIYAVPRDISNFIIFYNKNLFDRYKIPYPDKSWTMKEFLTIAQKLTHRPDVFGISFEEEPLTYMPYLTSNGYYDIPEFEKIKNNEGLRFYADLRQKYHVAPTKDESASATMAQMFLQGKLGMHLSGRWLVPKYREEAKFDWDVVEFPQGKAGSVVPMDASGWAISRSSKNKKQAIKLVKYLSSQNCSQKFATSGLIVPAREDSAKSKYFLDSQKPKNAKAFLSVIETSVPTKADINYKEITDDLKSKTEYLFNK